MWLISIVSLVLVAGICALGVFHRAFKDNLLQCIGMSMLCIACCGRIAWIWHYQITDASWMLVHLSMATYAIGTAVKVTVERGRERGWRILVNFDRWVDQRTGPGDFDCKARIPTRPDREARQ